MRWGQEWRRHPSPDSNGEERVGKVCEGLTHTVRIRERKKDIEAAIVVRGGREIKSAGAMPGP